MKKLSGQPTKGLWTPPKLLGVISKDRDKEEAGHGAILGIAARVEAILGIAARVEAILGIAARVEAILGIAARVGANLGAIVGPRVNTVHKVTCKMCIPYPLRGPHQKGESPSEAQRQKQAPKEAQRTTLWNPLSLTWTHG